MGQIKANGKGNNYKIGWCLHPFSDLPRMRVDSPWSAAASEASEARRRFGLCFVSDQPLKPSGVALRLPPHSTLPVT